jgi:hypothetical protein
MKKADNFDSSKWLIENKITFQSRLNEDMAKEKMYEVTVTHKITKRSSHVNVIATSEEEARKNVENSGMKLEDYYISSVVELYSEDLDGSRLNELLDYSKVEQLGKKAVEDYILKNNLDSIDDITYTGGSTFSDKANAVFYSTSSTGEITKYTVQYDANYNLVDIKTDVIKPTNDVIKPTNDVFKPTKIKGIKANVDDDYVTFLSRSGEYGGNIENDGTIRLEIFYPDMEEDEEEIDNNNWKNILGPNHMFVKIANLIPTEVDTEGDAVAITFKASDLIK